MTNTDQLKTVTITVTTGCKCSARLTGCQCAVTVHDFLALPLNWMDVIQGERPSDCPTVEAVAHLINRFPTAKITYSGCYDVVRDDAGNRRYVKHIQLARERATFYDHPSTSPFKHHIRPSEHHRQLSFGF